MAKGKISKKQTAVASVVPQLLESQATSEATASCAATSAGSTKSRRNLAATITNSIDRFKNIRDGLNPFQEGAGTMSVTDAIDLSQLAYWNVPIVRNVIDTMTELANSKVYLKGGNKKSRDFIAAWLDKIELWDLKDQFFREWWRSGNIFLYKFEANFTEDSLKRMTQVFGAKGTKIPVRYLILDPRQIKVSPTSTFAFSQFFKTLTGYEVERLRNPKTKEDQEIFDSLSPEDQKKIKTQLAPIIELEPHRLFAVFYKKQSYEPMAVPMVYPVLDDIDWKLQLKKIDRAIATTLNWSILLITMGSDAGVNPKSMQAIQELMQNESVGRTLVADYTTKGQWLVPDVKDILGPEKYTQVNSDIAQGLNTILFSEGEKFANTSIKVQVFIERLKEARSAFIYKFLQPEIKRICEDMGFKTYPEVYFQELDLKDDLQWARVYTRLMELNVLTPEEGIAAMESGKLPTPEESLESQDKYLKIRNDGNYFPIVGGTNTFEMAERANKSAAKGKSENGGLKTPAIPAGPNGRPPGISTPKSTTRVSPLKASIAFDYSKLQSVLIESNKLLNETEAFLKKKHKLKDLDEAQKEVSQELVKLIIANEDQKDWSGKIIEYSKKPKAMTETFASEVDQISHEFATKEFLAVLLNLSRIRE